MLTKSTRKVTKLSFLSNFLFFSAIMRLKSSKIGMDSALNQWPRLPYLLRSSYLLYLSIGISHSLYSYERTEYLLLVNKLNISNGASEHKSTQPEVCQESLLLYITFKFSLPPEPNVTMWERKLYLTTRIRLQ